MLLGVNTFEVHLLIILIHLYPVYNVRTYYMSHAQRYVAISNPSFHRRLKGKPCWQAISRATWCAAVADCPLHFSAFPDEDFRWGSRLNLQSV